MKMVIAAGLLLALTACKIGSQEESETMSNDKIITIVNQELSSIDSIEKIECQDKVDDRVRAMSCFKTTKEANEIEFEVNSRLKKHFSLLGEWSHEYTSSATYQDATKKLNIGILYTPESEALGNAGVAQGSKALIQAIVEDNPYAK